MPDVTAIPEIIQETAIIKPTKLPDTRKSIVHRFEIDNLKGYLILGLYPSGKLGEIFIEVAKEGSFTGGVLDTLATILSVSLQYGVPLQILVDHMENRRFEPYGLSMNPNIGEVSSVIDYIAKYLRRFL